MDRKIGDIVYIETWDNQIVEYIIKGLYRTETFKDEEGRCHVYETYDLGENTLTEEYQILEDDDPILLEYLEQNKILIEKLSKEFSEFVFGTSEHKITKKEKDIINKVLLYCRINNDNENMITEI